MAWRFTLFLFHSLFRPLSSPRPPHPRTHSPPLFILLAPLQSIPQIYGVLPLRKHFQVVSSGAVDLEKSEDSRQLLFWEAHAAVVDVCAAAAIPDCTFHLELTLTLKHPDWLFFICSGPSDSHLTRLLDVAKNSLEGCVILWTRRYWWQWRERIF